MKAKNFHWEETSCERDFNKFFLLESNHLGNVLQVVTDRKLAVDDGEYDLETYTYTSVTPDGIVDYFTSDVVSQSDYYPFGMLLPGRNSSEDEYRYGFQGQEIDDEIKGEGNSVNYTFRMHDPRVGRFFAVDPFSPKYPHYTPYSFSGNRVIDAIELEGLEEFKISDAVTADGAAIKVLTVTDVSAPFRILDEEGQEISNFKYNCFQSQMCGFQFNPNDIDFNGNMQPSLTTPNKPGQKIFTESFDNKLTNFLITTDDFTEVAPIFEDGSRTLEDFAEIIEGDVNSKTFTAPASETGTVTYYMGWSYMLAGDIPGVSIQVLDSDGNILLEEDADRVIEGSSIFSVNSSESFTINVNRGTSATGYTGSSFSFVGSATEATKTDVTNENCEEITCGE